MTHIFAQGPFASKELASCERLKRTLPRNINKFNSDNDNCNINKNNFINKNRKKNTFYSYPSDKYDALLENKGDRVKKIRCHSRYGIYAAYGAENTAQKNKKLKNFKHH